MQSLGYNSSYLPASPPVSDSDDGFTLPISYLYASIITLPEVELRSMIMKLADSSPRFQRAIMKELSQIQTITDAEPPTVSTTPSTKQGKKRRLKSHRNPKNLTLSTGSVRVVSQTHQLDYVYHPGRLEEEVYEFISGSPTESQVMRKISMWTCCDEDEWSPGCTSTPSFLGLFEPCTDSVDSPHTNFPVSNVDFSIETSS